MDINILRNLYNNHKVLWTNHCMERIGSRDISVDDVSVCINNGVIIEDYPEDYPYPSCLIFGYDTGKAYLHVVVGCDEIVVYIITAYKPSLDKFELDGKTRRKN